MKRWYQRQWWYIEKPMPWAMIVLWPFLWVVGTVDELRRRFSKPAPISYSVEPGLTIDFNGVTLPWNATARDIHDAMDAPTQAWEMPDDPFDWYPSEGYLDTPDYPEWVRRGSFYPIVDRDYE